MKMPGDKIGEVGFDKLIPAPLACPRCRGRLHSTSSEYVCRQCNSVYPVEFEIADFSDGVYFDSFDPDHGLTDEHRHGLAKEEGGSVRRIEDFYGPMLRSQAHSRVLDCGCGNGISVDILVEQGFDAWGNDISQLRKWQWRSRKERSRLVVASGLRLPFEDEFFHAVVSSGVLEHIGVEETAIPRYKVLPREDKVSLRERFLAEVSRVTAPGGTIYVDFPNGHFPVDFWHGDQPGTPRFHSIFEGFLPTIGEIRKLMSRVIPGATLRAVSPYGRLQFFQATDHRYGKLLSRPAKAFFQLIRRWPFRWLAGSPINPFLVLQISKPETEDQRQALL